ncbi:MAG: hypothetical protein LBE57_00940 [Methanosarcinales archaeon]|nr:hypothetical protein [Methanosarcinales archaeon]
MAKKKHDVDIANFNVTFGLEDKPLLSYFKEIVYPAFQAEIIREIKGKNKRYELLDCSIENFTGKDSDFVLIGRLVKDTIIESKSERDEIGNIKEVDKKYKMAPYSIFIIFLINHRMILVKNQVGSPDYREFGATVNYVLKEYIRERNKEIGKQKKSRETKSKMIEPYGAPTVNIANIPHLETIKEQLKDIKIQKITIKMFPLNGTTDYKGVFGSIRKSMGEVSSKTGGLYMNSPKNKTNVEKLIGDSEGLANFKIEGKTSGGEEIKIFDDKFREKLSIELNDDDNLKEKASRIFNEFSNKKELTFSDKENEELYKKKLTEIKKLN